MALCGILFSLVRPSQFYVQIFESRLGRITEIPMYINWTYKLVGLTTERRITETLLYKALRHNPAFYLSLANLNPT